MSLNTVAMQCPCRPEGASSPGTRVRDSWELSLDDRNQPPQLELGQAELEESPGQDWCRGVLGSPDG